jgi:cytidine deaminase
MVPPEIGELVAAARRVQGEFTLGLNFSAGGVAAALRGRSGRVYTGICPDLACGLGFCAEHAAVAQMLKHRESEIDAVVAVGAGVILAPSGRCRELMAQINPANLNCRVVRRGTGGTAAKPSSRTLAGHDHGSIKPLHLITAAWRFPRLNRSPGSRGG